MLITITDQNEIPNIVHALKCSESKRVDDILSRIIKDVITAIRDPLSSFFNKSFPSDQFPNKLNIAEIVPVYKCDDKYAVNNYCPISILPFLSKLPETVMHNRLFNYSSLHKN